MKTMSVGEFKTNFSLVLEQVKKGEKIAVTYGKKKRNSGVFFLLNFLKRLSEN